MYNFIAGIHEIQCTTLGKFSLYMDELWRAAPVMTSCRSQCVCLDNLEALEPPAKKLMRVNPNMGRVGTS